MKTFIFCAGLILINILYVCAQPSVSLVKDFSANYNNAYILSIYDNKIYVDVWNQTENQLWCSDGTEEGTHLLKTFIKDYFLISKPALYNEKQYFMADDGIHGLELWVSDGTEAGTKMVKDINSKGSSILDSWDGNITIYKNKMYFPANDSIYGQELWVSDGTEQGTYMLKDILIGGNNWGSRPYGFFIYKERLYFQAVDNIHQRELWVTDGTEEGTHLFKDINTDLSSGGGEGSFLGVINDKLFIDVFMSQTGHCIWTTDGTSEGTQFFSSTRPASSLYYYNGKNYFIALTQDPVNPYYEELWVTDGTQKATHKVKDIKGYLDSYIIPFNGSLFYSALDTSFGHDAIWLSDGTTTSTHQFCRIIQDDAYPAAYINEFATYNCKLYFVVSRSENLSLWVSDGTVEGTQSLIELSPDNNTPYALDSYILNTFDKDKGFIMNDVLYITANINNTGWNLWKIEDDCSNPSSQNDNQFSLFPVPASDFVTIKTDIPSTFYLIDINGKLIATHSITCAESIDISGLRNGIYFVRDEYGSSKKFVKTNPTP